MRNTLKASIARDVVATSNMKPKPLHPTWRDVSSYSQGDNERPPYAWDLTVDGIRMTICNAHIHHKGQWILNCAPWFRDKEFAEATLPSADAQTIACGMVSQRAALLVNALSAISLVSDK